MINQFNRWMNRLYPRARGIAAYDKILTPCAMDTPLPNETVQQIRATRGNPFMFQEVTRDRVASACPDGYPMADWLNLAGHALTLKDGLAVNMATCWAIGGLFADGPKVYCPTLEEWEGLSRVEMKVPMNLYRQPFPTVVVCIPEGAFRPVSAALGRPAFCLVRHWTAPEEQYGGIVSGLVVGDVQADAGCYELDFRVAWIDDGTEELETRLKDIDERSTKHPSSLPGHFPLCEDEPDAMARIKRAVLNAMLLLSQHAPRKIGETNPDHAARLRAGAKKKLPPKIAAANALALKLMPVVYGFQQHIRVVDRATEPEPPEGTGTHPAKTPHWRRGHWLNQVFGKGRSERRLQFRPACLVNEHLLSGPRSNTRVTMTTQ